MPRTLFENRATTWRSSRNDWHQTNRNDNARTLDGHNVDSIEQLYSIPASGAVVFGAAVVYEGIGYAADNTGTVHAFNVETEAGCGQPSRVPQAPILFLARCLNLLRWLQLTPFMLVTAMLPSSKSTDKMAVFFGQPVLDTTQMPSFWDPDVVGDMVIVGVASYENFGLQPNEDGTLPDATMRGSVAAVSASTGDLLWQTYTTSDQSQPSPRFGAGVGVWSSPTIDIAHDRVFIGTGQYYEPGNPPAEGEPDTSGEVDFADSLISLDLNSGALLGHHQYTADDVFGSLYPDGPDHDLGAPPLVFTQGRGDALRTYVGAGDKGGTYAVFRCRNSRGCLESTNCTRQCHWWFQAGSAYRDNTIFMAAHERADGLSVYADVPPGLSAVYLGMPEGVELSQNGSRTRILAVDALTGENQMGIHRRRRPDFAPLLANGLLYHGKHQRQAHRTQRQHG